MFSNNLPIYSQQITNVNLLTSLEELKNYLSLEKLEIKEWSENFIAVKIDVDVALPPLGNDGGVDIRSKEQILLVFNIKSYPEIAPMAFPDRQDFPKESLGHMYVAVNDKPPGLCLVRGSLNEWYANKRIKDTVIRIQNWLRDAASGELNEDGNQFEPLRLEGYNGTLQYDYDQISQVVEQKESYIEGANFAKIFLERTQSAKGLSWRFLKIVTPETLQDFQKEMIEKGEKKEDKELKHLYFGYVVWSDNEIPTNLYNVNLPRDWESFCKFCSTFNIEITQLVDDILENIGMRLYVSIPIIVAIRRPKQIIGFSNNLEFINFHVYLPEENIISQAISPEAGVFFKQHNQPLTIEKARVISGSSSIIKGLSLVAGAGALGSKIILHLAKSGNTNFWIADNDQLMPHNFVRHSLSPCTVNTNKAIALAEEIKTLYDGLPAAVNPMGFSATAGVLMNLKLEQLKYSWIFDFTASPAFLNQLSLAQLKTDTRVCKSYISDFGDLGLLFFEGLNRNPRIDDMQMLLYAEALNSREIQEWLNRETNASSSTSIVNVGIGCNSETTILADERVSLYAAGFAALIKSENEMGASTNGRVYLTSAISEPYFHTKTQIIEFQPLTILNPVNDNSWRVRVASGIVDNLNCQLRTASPYETGGVFIGSANYKTKTIHILGLIDAPPDSEANEVCFFRGVEGLSEKISDITDKTGGQIGYIGEWHTHPKGPEGLSGVDCATVKKFKQSYMHLPTPLPVLIMIVTPNGVLPFVY